MRKAFVAAISELAKNDEKIFLVTGDLGYRFLDGFAQQFPKRFLNIGVAEANLITFAAGLSSLGFIPFVYSIATFATMRPFEQIRNDVSLQNLNVKIVGIGGGLAYTKAGPTHHSMEDIALMRTLPNMTIIAPSDPDETFQAVKSIVKFKGPVYLRLERNPDSKKIIKQKKFIIGKARLILKGKEIAIITTGVKLYTALEVNKLLQNNKIYCSVISFPTIQPLDRKMIKQIIQNHNYIFTIEEHRKTGGLGSAISEFLAEIQQKNISFLRFGLTDSYSPISASYNELLKYHKLTPEQISRVILNKIS